MAAFLRRERGAKALLICRSQRKVLALAAALQEVISAKVALFHEGLPLVQRDRNAAWFAEPDGAQLLLSSEIGSEGRNFQFAHHLILLDLPLNPALLEQRIGRLDRIGQGADVHIHVPYLAGGAGEEKNEAGASLQRLAREGVGYLEFRVFDLDPFEANGVGLEALRFFHVLVLASLLRPAERIGAEEQAELAERWRWSTLCGGRWCECRPSPGAAGEREILPLLEFMAEIAAQLPPGYAAAVAAARERWAGRWRAARPGRARR